LVRSAKLRHDKQGIARPMTERPEPLSCNFADDGSIPNNPHLPALIYTQAVELHGDPAVALEHVFTTNGWLPDWRDGIYDYHHYHSTAHEVLGIAKGQVKVRLGGEQGRDFDLQAGDVVVLPAGTGHKCLSASDDLLVVGAYPPGQSWDLLRGASSDRPKALKNIAQVPLPESDPVYGADGPLPALWQGEE
jgi:uncharacterized protein YjlB